jgi:hypothetical protein
LFSYFDYIRWRVPKYEFLLLNLDAYGNLKSYIFLFLLCFCMWRDIYAICMAFNFDVARLLAIVLLRPGTLVNKSRIAFHFYFIIIEI